MKNKILTILEILLILLFIKLVGTFVINEIFIHNYNQEKYNTSDLKIISLLNFPESYIYHYNNGNILYKNEEYTKAISEYEVALQKHPPKEKECSIRINLALAKLHNLEKDTEDNKKKNIETLKSARKVLCENGCANENDNNGHSEKAEQLKADIDKKLKELENNSNNDSEEEKDDNEEQNSKKEKQDNKTKKAEEELKKIQQESLKERQQDLENADRLWNDDYTYIYYEGKRW